MKNKRLILYSNKDKDKNISSEIKTGNKKTKLNYTATNENNSLSKSHMQLVHKLIAIYPFCSINKEYKFKMAGL